MRVCECFITNVSKSIIYPHSPQFRTTYLLSPLITSTLHVFCVTLLVVIAIIYQ